MVRMACDHLLSQIISPNRSWIGWISRRRHWYHLVNLIWRIRQLGWMNRLPPQFRCPPTDDWFIQSPFSAIAGILEIDTVNLTVDTQPAAFLARVKRFYLVPVLT